MFNNFQNKFWLLIPLLLFFIFTNPSGAATCTITNARWGSNTVKVGENIQMIVTVQNPTDCANQNIGVQVFENDPLRDALIAGPVVQKFTGTSNTINFNYTFTVQNWEAGGSENPGTIYFTALPQNQSSATKSNAIFLYPTQSGNGGTTITNFNVTQLNPSTIRFNFTVDIPRPGELKSFCGADPFWRAIETNPIKLVRNGQFALDKTSYKFDFDEPGQTANKTYQGTIICAGKDVAVSQPISCNANNVCSSGGGGTCNNNGVCDAGETAAMCPNDKCPIKPGEPTTFIFKLENPIQATNFVELIDVIATWLFNIAIPIAVAMIIYAGVMFLISRGDTSKITKARQILLYAVVGLAIILIGKGFITLIESILNLGATP